MMSSVPSIARALDANIRAVWPPRASGDGEQPWSTMPESTFHCVCVVDAQGKINSLTYIVEKMKAFYDKIS
jgi:hypothetical protein